MRSALAAGHAARQRPPKLLSDAPFFDDMQIKGQRPVLALLVRIEQLFFHCQKAFMRSELWNPETWRPGSLPARPKLINEIESAAETLEQLEEHYSPKYTAPVYR